MAGNKKPHGNHLSGERTAPTYANERVQTATLEAPLTVNPPCSHVNLAGPFNFESLTSQYKIGIIRNGITKKQLEAFKSEAGLDYQTLGRLLAVSRTTLIKKKGEDKFDRPTSERILLLAELLSYGREVFASRDLFNAWIKIPSRALGDKAPLELLDTLYGIEEVKKELSRIEYGVY